MERLKSLDSAASRPKDCRRKKIHTQWLDGLSKADTILEMSVNVEQETTIHLLYVFIM